jgi:putative transposase
VRARLVPQAQDWQWSSVAAHLAGRDDKLVKASPILERYGGFATLLGNTIDDDPGFKQLRQSETTGRPLGSEAWMDKLEKITGKILKPQKRGPKIKGRDGK